MAAQLLRTDEATLQARAVRSWRRVRRARRDSLTPGSKSRFTTRRPILIERASEGGHSSQDAAREQDRANQNRHPHGAHDTEPFLVRRRVGNFAFQNFAHRTTRSMIRNAVSCARGPLVREKLATIVERLTPSSKSRRCRFSVTTTIGAPSLYCEGTPELAPLQEFSGGRLPGRAVWRNPGWGGQWTGTWFRRAGRLRVGPGARR